MYLILACLLTAAPPSVHFDAEIIPLLTQAGCNAGACHGAAAGRGGFRLSLLGSDPTGDYDRIVRELEGRRVNLARPARSLVLTKPAGDLDHEGGVRLEEGSPAHQRMLAWLSAGAPRGKPVSLDRLEVEPREQVVAGPGARVRLKAIAHFRDGSQQDVTSWTTFSTAEAGGVVLKQNGEALVEQRGQHTILARFMSGVVAVRISAPWGDAPVDLTHEPRRNFIDDETLAALEVMQLAPSPPADDATYLRRVRLDLTGRLPDPAEVRDFLADARPDKRERLVDRLLASPEFVDYWTLYWAQLFRVRSSSMNAQGAQAFHGWLREQVRTAAPADTMARTLLTAEGDSFQIGPANFTRATGDPRNQAEFVAEALLGVRLRCANCHDHPFDRWTQDDYHGLAAVFARLERGREVRLAARGDVTHPRTGEPAVPRLPGVRNLPVGSDGRGELAAWVTARDNPYFARAMVNRLWRAMFGRGLVEPVDDLRATNPATHPRLLDKLAADFVEHGYDLRRTLRLIATSAAYGRSASTQALPAAVVFYATTSPRALSAEVLADAIADVTGVPHRYGDLPAGTRAVQLVDGLTPSPALDVLGRCSRDGTCQPGVALDRGLATRLHLINGELLNARLSSAEGQLHRRLAAEPDDARLLSEFYLLTLGREPRAAEQAWLAQRLQQAKAPAARAQLWEDLLWSLLNSREFSTNH